MQAVRRDIDVGMDSDHESSLAEGYVAFLCIHIDLHTLDDLHQINTSIQNFGH